MNFDFGEVLTRAWKIIWKHKVLWIFGILASCGRGNGGGNSGSSGNSGFNGGSNPDQFSYQMDQFGRWLENNLWVIIAAVIILLLISLIFVALGFMGRIALVIGASKADKGAESLGFGELWSKSLPYFWRVFGLSFLIGLAMLAIILPFVLIGVLTAGIGFACLLPLICLLIPIAIVLSVIIEQANAAIVLENLGMLDGFKRGWEVTQNNAGPMAIMWLILAVGGGVIGFVIALPLVLAILFFILGGTTEAAYAIWVGVACLCLYLPFLIGLGGALTAYVQTAWALTFMRLTAPKQNAAETLVAANA